MWLVSSCCGFCQIHWSQVLSWEWRCSWSSADRRCSNYIWVINSFIAYRGATYIRGFTVTTLPLTVKSRTSGIGALSHRSCQTRNFKMEVSLSLRKMRKRFQTPLECHKFLMSSLSLLPWKWDLTKNIISTTDAIHKYNSHPSVEKIKTYYNGDINILFHTIDVNTVMLMIGNINPRKATGYDNIPGKAIKIAHHEL